MNLLSLVPDRAVMEETATSGGGYSGGYEGGPGFSLEDLNRFCAAQAEIMFPFPFRPRRLNTGVITDGIIELRIRIVVSWKAKFSGADPDLPLSKVFYAKQH